MRGSQFIGILVITLAFLIGLSSTVDAGTIIIKTPPPAIKVEIRPFKPFPNAVWIPGHWSWKRGHYVWVKGHWVKQRKGFVWVRGHWVRRHGGWVWIPGHWKRY
ncbi:MAG: hypothetical protein D6748_03505 [Calditrichaeota bacterium]|nr:MAG: hypothetical protein D6748_03505 [Calditrichota bacterium]